MQNDTSPQLLPVRPMARAVGVPIGWLKAEAKSGRVPSLRAGSRFLFSPNAVVAALAARAAQTATESRQEVAR